MNWPARRGRAPSLLACHWLPSSFQVGVGHCPLTPPNGGGEADYCGWVTCARSGHGPIRRFATMGLGGMGTSTSTVGNIYFVDLDNFRVRVAHPPTGS